MLWLTLASVAVGTACGMLFRLPTFVIIWGIFAVAGLVASALIVWGPTLLHILVAAVALQVGYILGILARMAGYSRHNRN